VFQIAPVLSSTPCSVRSHPCACASVIPGRERMWAFNASTCAHDSLRDLCRLFELIPHVAICPPPDQCLVMYAILTAKVGRGLPHWHAVIHRPQHSIDKSCE
jgi:hypothetical protein